MTLTEISARVPVVRDISDILARLWARLFRRKSEIPIPQPIAPPIAARPAIKDDELGTHSFKFKGAILDNLDRYFHYLRKMKNSDPTSYGLMGRTGLHITPDDGMLYNHDMPETFKQHRPAFGGILLHGSSVSPDTKKHIHIKFIYFSRRKPSPFEAREGFTFYDVTLFYTDENKVNPVTTKYGLMANYRVMVTKDNEAILLKQRGTDTIKEKREKKKRDRFTIPSMSLSYPSMLVDIATQNKTTPERVGVSCFLWACSAVEEGALANTRIMVQKGDAAAEFNIPIKRTAYFFKDREPVLDNGKTKRIFHIVRPHIRETRLGAKFIRFHHRGLRKFEWNGYRVTITVPGLHHAPLIETDFETISVSRYAPLPDGYVTPEKAGEKIAARLTA